MSIDETSLSDGELYAIVSNKDAKGKRGAPAAIILGTKSEDVIAALKNIDQSVRETVTEITLDLSSSMRKIAHRAFPKAVQVTDRFHVQKLAMVGTASGELTHVSCPSGEVGENTLLRVLHDIYIYRNRSSKTVWFTSLRSRLMVPSWFRII